VQVGYIELEQPLLGEALADAARTARRVLVVPLFLFSGGHVKNDLPLALADARRRFPSVQFSAAPAFGVHPLLVELGWERVESVLSSDPEQRARTVLLVVGRGASDPDANGDFYKVARLIGEGRRLLYIEPTFIGITAPRLETSLEFLARLRPERLVVLPYFLFAGRLVARITEQVAAFVERHPWIRASVAGHLGSDPRLLALIDERARQAIQGESLLPCDTCQYRVALPGLAHQVGGLRALLYSVRHTLAHENVSAPAHSHRPLKKHVLVCGNADCVDRGSLELLDSIRRQVKRVDRERGIRVTRTSCMGRCGDGPTVAIYPDGVWYRRVLPGDATEIVEEHLLRDRLVTRLIDSLMH
jgi:sirohydrochlorin ferrochelatase/(2Fe-2S) ferredoxin